VEAQSAEALFYAIALLRDPRLAKEMGPGGPRVRPCEVLRGNRLRERVGRIPAAAAREPKPARLPERLVDVCGALAGLAVFAPLLAAVWMAIRVRMGRPVLFRQFRAGRGGRPFLLYKFRTMLEARDSAGALLPDSERLTRLGRFLRATSLDELPQLWNVLKGEMSPGGTAAAPRGVRRPVHSRAAAAASRSSPVDGMGPDPWAKCDRLDGSSSWTCGTWRTAAWLSI